MYQFQDKVEKRVSIEWKLNFIDNVRIRCLLYNVKMSKTTQFYCSTRVQSCRLSRPRYFNSCRLLNTNQVPQRYLYTWRIKQKCIRIPLLYNKFKWLWRINRHSEYRISMINGHKKNIIQRVWHQYKQKWNSRLSSDLFNVSSSFISSSHRLIL